MPHNPEQVQMIWPPGRSITPPPLPDGYTLRTYHPGVEARFYWMDFVPFLQPPETVAQWGDLRSAGLALQAR